MSSQFYCGNCHSSEFYEDDQGYYICQYCGIMSQDHYAETNDMEDGAVTSNVRRVYDKSKDDDKKSTSSQSNPVLLQFLEVYQYCLKMLLSRMLDVAEVEKSDRQDYMNTLKYLWMDYLKAWNRSECTCNMLQAFVTIDEGCCSCSPNELQHPLFPSKPLLMGFVYLTLRLHRSWVTPAELVHCCLSGSVPYSNLWEHIPEEVRAGRVDTVYRGFFTDQHLGPTRFLSCSNILFHASTLADIVCIDMPPLNEPLIASMIIQRLGLPACVWSRYCQLTQVYSHSGGGQSILSAAVDVAAHSNHKPGRKSKLTVPPTLLSSAADSKGVQYVEDILVMLIMAVKCCKGWQKWPTVRSTDSSEVTVSSSGPNRVILSTDSEVSDAVPRKDLKAVLDSIRYCVPSYTTYRAINPSKQAYAFNQAVMTTLDSDYYTPIVSTSEAAEARVASASSSSSSATAGVRPNLASEEAPILFSTSSNVRLNNIVYEPGSVFEAVKEQKTGSSSRHSSAEGAEEVEEGVCTYVTYARYDHSTAIREGGGQYDLPSTLLLERVASWALVPVSLLHKLLLEREEVLIGLLLNIRHNQ